MLSASFSPAAKYRSSQAVNASVSPAGGRSCRQRLSCGAPQPLQASSLTARVSGLRLNWTPPSLSLWCPSRPMVVRLFLQCSGMIRAVERCPRSSRGESTQQRTRPGALHIHICGAVTTKLEDRRGLSSLGRRSDEGRDVMRLSDGHVEGVRPSRAGPAGSPRRRPACVRASPAVAPAEAPLPALL